MGQCLNLKISTHEIMFCLLFTSSTAQDDDGSTEPVEVPLIAPQDEDDGQAAALEEEL